ncbi:hypothetical protein RMCBS344292_16496 [Rhizopus microsporus]|nr:hypothetical protein RMCBS344292_16496 [Rhizopus microsporus]
MIMNTEWCNFGSSKRTLPCTWFDRKLSRESINPQFHVFEKMTTGIFLGELSSEVLNTVHSFDTSYMYVCEADDSDSLEDTRIILEDMLDLSKTTMGDREVVKKVCELVGMRAAQLVGASIAAIVQHMVERGIGMTDQGYAISISGSIYEDYPSFHPRVCRTIKELIPEEIACKLSVGVVKHSRIVGAAIVAMMAEKIAADKRSRS